ncbi:MAG: hypothetical protein KGY61_12750, partial [Desulfobacterales bacterium]|nr:hypothetical protein [Desulfobacterales bacterium]
MKGYFGKFLKVDLSTQKTEDLPVSEADRAAYIGGATLGARIIYDYAKPGTDPLSPDNPLIFATGPFTGSNVPMVSRAVVCGISPGTGLWGEATTGGQFPRRMKATGYDGILITGRAASPVYLSVTEDGVEIRKADHLWGNGDDIYETQRKIKAETGGQTAIACIGKGGEGLVNYANIMNDEGRAAGRCGMGALMGSKNLKALCVFGRKKANMANPQRLKTHISEARSCIRNQANTNAYKLYGTNLYMDLGMRLGDVPTKYYSKRGPVFRDSRLETRNLFLFSLTLCN